MRPTHSLSIGPLFSLALTALACGSSSMATEGNAAPDSPDAGGASQDGGSGSSDGGAPAPDAAASPPFTATSCLSTGSASRESLCAAAFGDPGACNAVMSSQIVMDPTSTAPFAPMPAAFKFFSHACMANGPVDPCSLSVEVVVDELAMAPPNGLESLLDVAFLNTMEERGTAIDLVPSAQSIGTMVEKGTDVAGPSGGFKWSRVSLRFQNTHDSQMTNPMTTSTLTPIEIAHDTPTSGFAVFAFTGVLKDGTTLKGAVRAPWEVTAGGCPQ